MCGVASVRNYGSKRRMAPRGPYSKGPAGPVIRIDPKTMARDELPAFCPAYARYVAAKRSKGETPKTYAAWRNAIKHVGKKKKASDKFDAIERRYSR